jgi:hypothetical protein
MNRQTVSISSFLAILSFIFSGAFSGCGKGVVNDGNSGNNSANNGAPPTTTTPAGGGTITPTPGPSSVTGCPADQLTSFNFAQTNPAESVIDLGLSGSSEILFVSVGGQAISYSFDGNSGSVTLGDSGQPGEIIHIDVCLPSPIGKPTGKPSGDPGKPTPAPAPSKQPCPVKS